MNEIIDLLPLSKRLFPISTAFYPFIKLELELEISPVLCLFCFVCFWWVFQATGGASQHVASWCANQRGPLDVEWRVMLFHQALSCINGGKGWTKPCKVSPFFFFVFFLLYSCFLPFGICSSCIVLGKCGRKKLFVLIY